MKNALTMDWGMPVSPIVSPVVMPSPHPPPAGLPVMLDWNQGYPPGTMTCWLAGEPFLLETGLPAPDSCQLTHRHWSLCGFGPDPTAALDDLRVRAAAVAPVYIDRPEAELTETARTLRDFLRRVVPRQGEL